MAPVAVVTDSTAYLPAEVASSAAVRVVSLYVNSADGTGRAETEIGDLGAYWRELADLEHLPTTSQPSVGDFAACYTPLLEDGYDIVSIHLSAGISGTTESARLAAQGLRETYPERTIAVRDSRSASGGLALIVMAAAAAARGGGDVGTVASRADAAIEQARVWFAVDTLEYLKRGGRIGGAQAWLGSALRIKPILTIDGEITPIERVRTSGRAFERMVAFAQELKDGGADAWAVQHIQAPDQAARLVDRVREIMGREPAIFSEIGPVIGTHVGPGLLGIGGLPASLLDA